MTASTPPTLDDLKRDLLGDWISLAPEVRPSAARNPDGSLRPFHLTRAFTALPGDRFELTIVNAADALARTPLARIFLRGQMRWRGQHPIAPGAQRVDFIADEAYDVTPLHPGFAALLHQAASADPAPWAVGQTRSVLGQAFAPFGLVEGRHFMEYDLVYLHRDHLYWGARHVDGRGFDTEENRPTNLQIPMVRA